MAAARLFVEGEKNFGSALALKSSLNRHRQSTSFKSESVQKKKDKFADTGRERDFSLRCRRLGAILPKRTIGALLLKKT